MIKAIIFDCFGVLVTEGWFTFRDTYFPEGVLRQQAVDLHRAADWGSISYEDFEHDIAALAGVSVETVRSHLNDNVPNDPLFTLIETELKPHYKIGVLSNAAADWLGELFTPEQRALFDAAVLSYEIKTAKPDPRAYQAIVDKLGVTAQECIFIDDNEYFCTAAREQGMRAIWYKDFMQTQGELRQLLANAEH